MDVSSTETTDVFSLSDHLLADRLHFVKEIGFGNWGSVWLCRPKSKFSSDKHRELEVAVKLVHRSKTTTTAARVRSLWNEMKIVRSFKTDPHPSIIPFHSFIITPSYALITMAYLPTLVPVEVSEPRAKEWFRSLLSGVYFLHERGVVHNDIKPANILLSHKNVPVLVDFGFAEKYDLASSKAFHSNLTYGTPEYLSPERARGLPHDTRKSDIWALGVTFFEILVGRTPFEYEEGEQFASKADLEKYWARTMRGKWVGTYSIPKPVETLLKRMIVPNADLRCTAKDAIGDSYWDVAAGAVIPHKHGHKKSASVAVPPKHQTHDHTLSSSFTSPPSKDASTPKDASAPKDTAASRLLDISLPWASNSRSPSCSSASRSVSRTPEKEKKDSTRIGERHHTRSKSQPKVRSPYPNTDGYRQGRKLSTVQASPAVKSTRKLGPAPPSPTDSTSMSGSPGSTSLGFLSSVQKPLGPKMAVNVALKEKEGGWNRGVLARRENTHTPRAKENAPVADRKPHSAHTKENDTPKMSGRKPRSRSRAAVLSDLTGFAKNMDLSAHGMPKTRGKDALRSAADLRNISPTDVASVSRLDLRSASKTDVWRVSRNDLNLGRNTSRASLNDPDTTNASATDLPNASTAVNVSGIANTTSSTMGKGSVRDRMREWERERERLREMERLAELQREAESIMTSANPDGSDDETEMSDEEVECAIQKEVQGSSPVTSQNSSVELHMKPGVKTEVKKEEAAEVDEEIDLNVTSYRADLSAEHIEIARIGVRASAQLLTMGDQSISALVMDRTNSASTAPAECGLPCETHQASESGFIGLKQSVKASIDKGVRMYKSSTLGQITNGRTTPVWCASPEPMEFEHRRSGEVGRFSYEEIRPEGSAEIDRMNLWIQNVERVVEETRQNFAFASNSITRAQLPLSPPISRSTSQAHGLNLNASRSSSRLPRRILAANEIFCDDPNAPLSPGQSVLADQSNLSYISPNDTSLMRSPAASANNVLTDTPRRRRRATISTRSPKANENDTDALVSPSKRREKSRSQGNLDKHIRPVDKLELDLAREAVATPTPRLSAVLDRNLFIAPPIAPRLSEMDAIGIQTPNAIRRRSILFDDTDITASPFHVEPYPTRKFGDHVILNSPDRRRVEGVYDRFLMSTTGVKRLGKGYQSENVQPIQNNPSTLECKPTNNNPRNFKVFSSARRVMHPPVSSDDQWRNPSVDDMGFITCSASASYTSKEDSKTTATTTLVRRAIKAIVPGRTASRRLSRTIVA